MMIAALHKAIKVPSLNNQPIHLKWFKKYSQMGQLDASRCFTGIFLVGHLPVCNDHQDFVSSITGAKLVGPDSFNVGVISL
jgi:hypothetical protein